MGWIELYRRGAEHLGVVTSGCASACGVRGERLRQRAEREGWDRPLDGAYLLPGWRGDGRSRTVARALVSGREVVVTGHSALALHGLLRAAPSVTELLVVRNRRTVVVPGVRTRWTRSLPSASITTCHGVAVTDVARSLAAVAATTTPGRLRALALDATARGSLSAARLERELDARAVFPGRDRLRRLRDELVGDGSASGFEFDTRDRLAALGLAPDREQAAVATADGVRHLDLAYRAASVGVECLGFAYHSSPEHLESDTRRTNALAALDRWLILRLTFRMFHLDFAAFATQLRACLRARGLPTA